MYYIITKTDGSMKENTGKQSTILISTLLHNICSTSNVGHLAYFNRTTGI